VTLKEIKELIDLITEKNLAEFEMEKAGFKIRISRSQGAEVLSAPAVSIVPSDPPAAQAVMVAPPRGPVVAPVPPSPPAPPRVEEGVTVKSPIVGTFYRAPDPTAPPFVKEGDRVKKGQVLCIVEAMKLMNEIESEVDGEILRILVENGHPVEFGQELFAIRPLS